MSEVSALIRVVCKKTLQDCNNPNSVVRTYCISIFLGEQMLLVVLGNNGGLF